MDRSPTENSAEQPNSTEKPKWRKILLRVVIVIAALLLCGFIVLFAIYNHMMNKINRPDPNETYMTEEELLESDAIEAAETAEDTPEDLYPVIDPEDITMPEAADLIGQEDKIVNILLVGQDRRPGEGRARSDSMILCSFNKSKGTLQMISFLRDLYVSIPGGYLDNRLNASYALGGFELLDATLETNFGVQIDANIEVDFTGFQKVIDILGGVDVELTQAEVDYLNKGRDWNLTAGMNHLDGEKALAYSRIRYLDSDFVRTDRQRKVLTSLLDSMRDMDLATAKDLADELFPLVTTDMTNMEILTYVTTLLPMLSDAEVVSLHIPEDDAFYYATIREMAVVVPYMDACRATLEELLGE